MASRSNDIFPRLREGGVTEPELSLVGDHAEVPRSDEGEEFELSLLLSAVSVAASPDPWTRGIALGGSRSAASSARSLMEAPPKIFSRGRSRFRFFENLRNVREETVRGMERTRAAAENLPGSDCHSTQ